MTKHKIVIELDVPEGLESVAHDVAYWAIVLINERTRKRCNDWHGIANTLHNVTADAERPDAAQKVIDDLRALAKREDMATGIITMGMSEISHAMSEADSQWRRGQVATEASGKGVG